MNAVSANGTTGILIHSLRAGFVFRVYNGDYTFTDYDISHSDLQVTINDEDAYFYDNKYLDHSPQTLGIAND